MNQNLINYPLPLISINKDGFITAKNHNIESTFSMVHVGALVKKYTDIDLSVESFSRGKFCNVECSYCTMFENDEVLLFLSPDTVSTHTLPFNIIELYRKRINEVCAQPTSMSKTLDRKYVNSVSGNLIKANYFNAYHGVFDRKLQKQDPDNTTVLTKVLTAIKNVTTNNFDDVDVSFNIDYYSGNMVARINELNLIGIILNSLSFCIMNAANSVNVSLTENNKIAEISFSFSSRASFDKWLNPDSDTLLNSSLSLLIATELAKNADYEYSITKNGEKNVIEYTLNYKIPVDITSDLVFSSSDDTMPVVKRLYSLIFFGEAT